VGLPESIPDICETLARSRACDSRGPQAGGGGAWWRHAARVLRGVAGQRTGGRRACEGQARWAGSGGTRGKCGQRLRTRGDW